MHHKREPSKFDLHHHRSLLKARPHRCHLSNQLYLLSCRTAQVSAYHNRWVPVSISESLHEASPATFLQVMSLARVCATRDVKVISTLRFGACIYLRELKQSCQTRSVQYNEFHRSPCRVRTCRADSPLKRDWYSSTYRISKPPTAGLPKLAASGTYARRISRTLCRQSRANSKSMRRTVSKPVPMFLALLEARKCSQVNSGMGAPCFHLHILLDL